MDLGLRGKRVLVTGASKGIGLATARCFAAEGCTLKMVSRDARALDRAASDIAEEFGVLVDAEAHDLKDPGSHAALAKSSTDIDILVNNAGDVPAGSIEVFSAESMIDAWRLKVFGFVGLMHSFHRRMGSQGHGVIVNVMGTAGLRADSHLIAQSGANAALIAITKALGASAPDVGVRVLGVNPGPTSTDRMVSILRAQAERQLGSAERWQELQNTLPFGRAARPDEIADMVVFLSSPRCGYVSGTIINVDGGKAERSS